MSVTTTYVQRQERRDTAANWTSNNPTPLAGEWCYETDTGKVKIGDGSTAWTSLDYVTDINIPLRTYVMNDLTSGDIVYALPTAVGFDSEIVLEWENGTPTSNELSFTTVSAQTIGGIVAATWLGQGAGSIVLYSDGSNWRVKEFTDTGTNANGVWEKFKNGTLVNSKSMNIGTSTAINYALSFFDTTYKMSHAVLSTTAGDNYVLNIVGGGKTASSVNANIRRSTSGAAGSADVDLIIRGRWTDLLLV